MLPTNSFRRVFIALTAIASISLGSVQAAAPTVERCGTGFRPDPDDSAYYVCQDDQQKEHRCKEDSCREGGHRWKDFMFENCIEYGDYYPTGNPPQTFYVKQFSADNTARKVHAKGYNGLYYHCTFKDPGDFNARRPTCSNCGPMPLDNDDP
ncbi:hypothetical protein MJO28_003963 [Puccinia striiformis f. sp. tritici]|uniref:Secreted protein n=2 Tax=Puccinia striiformis f. sp. tritici TaxID=168172 RepID=A0A0L0UVX8_9BASI|nr:hypothetical protein Pst134EA_007414 [Puccinia striiformis f. sp. tritici]XP_047809612.1 hypothetical protein Pst134EA_007423 [Puccinia striiformis f. sp. tritici]KAI9616924.1 hypothetical protein H4Q26_010560 [Puccinia striiformis f. sp. tritici PST-130]KNE91086.1 hypothetical protein PSTG_15482 [Puccinia striiformis f. sp. tritici PST-78]KAH9460369.1 hypothetical protein Pst134EB_008543 [Puccinia striiformis f. sp. tritici]KAH9470149.1 hypothetical protein Pst134EA_007414 [Puccinia striif